MGRERNQHRREFEQFQDRINRLFPEFVPQDVSEIEKNRLALSRTVTFQVTDACNLACTYCYQINKGTRRMSFETAKKFIDLLLSGEKGFADYVSPSISPGIILEFIGGEPFLEIDLIDQICDYFFHECIRLDHPWATIFMISICSNGVLYFDEKVQRFLHKHRDNVSFSITIDGNKELHDSCRVFPNGKPSYDLAVAGAMDWMNKGYYMGSKITIAPGNITHVADALQHMIELGYREINANCVYEKGWEPEHATELYWQLKRTADYIDSQNIADDLYLSIFIEEFFRPKRVDDLENWCGGTGMMLACDPDGYLYPCIRYMESSLGCHRAPLRIGDIENGLGVDGQYAQTVNCLNCITRRTQSTDECFYCPIADGCSWCSAYNYQELGTPDGRVTYLCEMHKARALANAYYWAKFYEKYEPHKKTQLWVSKDWALKIIPEEEFNMLLSLPNLIYCGDITWQAIKEIHEREEQ